MASPGSPLSARSPSARSGGSRYSRQEFRELVNHPSDDVVFRTQMLAASHNPLASDKTRHRISGLSSHVPTDPSVVSTQPTRCRCL